MKLTLEHLSKSYGQLRALDDFNMDFSPGIYALLGPNGAGKSTLIKLLSMNLDASQGIIRCDGTPVSELKENYRSRIGYVPQQQGMPKTMRAVEFMSFMASLKGMSKKTAAQEIDRLLEAVGLSEKRNEKIGSFSGGMKQRLLIAQALLDQPDFLILDEPTAGLDPRERIRIRNILSKEASSRIVLYATHVVSDIEGIAGNVILLQKGKIAASGSPAELTRQLEGKVFERDADEMQLEQLKNNPELLISQIRAYSGKYAVRIISDLPPNPDCDHPVSPSLEDVYLYYFGWDDAS